MSTGPLYSGGVGPDMSIYTVTTSDVTGTATLINWVGTHPLQLKCTNGVADASATARGNAGLFNSVYSA